MVDLHIHSNKSDGSKGPAEIVGIAYDTGLEAIALTDHDTTAGVGEAVRRGKALNMPVLPGIEFSAAHTGELHILGYLVDIHHERLKAYVAALEKARMLRVRDILDKLNRQNVDIRYEEVAELANGAPLGRPHIGTLLIRKGYVKDMEDAFLTYLRKGAPAFTDRQKILPEKAIRLIKAAGGIAVLAHPKYIETDDMHALVKKLAGYGLDGIEAFYPAHTDAEVEHFESIAKKFKLLVTTGSDYHGDIKPEIDIGEERRETPYLKTCVTKIMQLYDNRLK